MNFYMVNLDGVCLTYRIEHNLSLIQQYVQISADTFNRYKKRSCLKLENVRLSERTVEETACWK